MDRPICRWVYLEGREYPRVGPVVDAEADRPHHFELFSEEADAAGREVTPDDLGGWLESGKGIRRVVVTYPYELAALSENARAALERWAAKEGVRLAIEDGDS